MEYNLGLNKGDCNGEVTVWLRTSVLTFCENVIVRVRTGPGKSWNLIIWIPSLESHGILVQVLEFDVGKFVRSCLLFWIVLTCMRENTLNYGKM